VFFKICDVALHATSPHLTSSLLFLILFEEASNRVLAAVISATNKAQRGCDHSSRPALRVSADETREEEGGEESKNVDQQVVAVAAAAGQHASPLVPAAVPPGGMVPWIVSQFNPNPYFYGAGFNPFSTNSFNSNI
jgi:hypothetical protein